MRAARRALAVLASARSHAIMRLAMAAAVTPVTSMAAACVVALAAVIFAVTGHGSAVEVSVTSVNAKIRMHHALLRPLSGR